MFRCLLLVVLTLPAALRAETVTVAAAVSLKEVMADVGKSYKQETGDDVKFIFGASGTLEAQIRNGAPVDVFISAADRQVKELIAAKMADESTRRIIAGNSLVLITPAKGTTGLKDLAGLSGDSIKKIAIGDPKIVAAGEYAEHAIKAAKIAAKVEDKLVFGASVRQVLAYVEREEVDVGIVYGTDARQAGAKVKVVATVDEATYDRIEYPAIVLKDAANSAGARRFLDFLAKDKAKAILKEKGFRPAKSEGKP